MYIYSKTKKMHNLNIVKNLLVFKLKHIFSSIGSINIFICQYASHFKIHNLVKCLTCALISSAYPLNQIQKGMCQPPAAIHAVHLFLMELTMFVIRTWGILCHFSSSINACLSSLAFRGGGFRLQAQQPSSSQTCSIGARFGDNEGQSITLMLWA